MITIITGVVIKAIANPFIENLQLLQLWASLIGSLPHWEAQKFNDHMIMKKNMVEIFYHNSLFYCRSKTSNKDIWFVKYLVDLGITIFILNALLEHLEKTSSHFHSSKQ